MLYLWSRFLDNTEMMQVTKSCSFKVNSTGTKGGTKKSGPGVKSSNFSANIGPTETYYIPNE